MSAERALQTVEELTDILSSYHGQWTANYEYWVERYCQCDEQAKSDLRKEYYPSVCLDTTEAIRRLLRHPIRYTTTILLGLQHADAALDPFDDTDTVHSIQLILDDWYKTSAAFDTASELRSNLAQPSDQLPPDSYYPPLHWIVGQGRIELGKCIICE